MLSEDDKLLLTPNERCDTYHYIFILPLKSARLTENNKNMYKCVFRGYPSRILIVILHSTALQCQTIFCIRVIFFLSHQTVTILIHGLDYQTFYTDL